MARRDDPAPPRDSTPDLPPMLEPVTRLVPRGEVHAARIDGLDGEVDASHAELVETLWEAPTLDRLDLTGARIVDSRIADARVTVVVGRDARWRNVEIDGGRLGTVDLQRAELDGVTFRGIRIDYLGSPSAHLAHVRFVGCRFGTIDLPEARAERVAFEDCRADEMDTRGLRAVDLDLRGLEVLSITDPSALRGATLTARQCETHGTAFADALGVKIRD
ncbi:hypothetical protein LJR045_001481 [Microbacterium sp. LjRoot45]|uniref:pentapeptide repeat-containing protein n=1 Tax=Microbacterium sp. LjRoot45 TaxID=3342329 RepID=UPI003ED13189